MVKGTKGTFGSDLEGMSSLMSRSPGLPYDCPGEPCREGLLCGCCGVEGYAPERVRGVLMACTGRCKVSAHGFFVKQLLRERMVEFLSDVCIVFGVVYYCMSTIV